MRQREQRALLVAARIYIYMHPTCTRAHGRRFSTFAIFPPANDAVPRRSRNARSRGRAASTSRSRYAPRVISSVTRDPLTRRQKFVFGDNRRIGSLVKLARTQPSRILTFAEIRKCDTISAHVKFVLKYQGSAPTVEAPDCVPRNLYLGNYFGNFYFSSEAVDVSRIERSRESRKDCL